jgi:hypothetical protein
MAVEPIIPIIPIIQCEMAELYMYNTVLYRKISGLRRRYDTYSTVTTNHTRDLRSRSVSYQPSSYSDPALTRSLILFADVLTRDNYKLNSNDPIAIIVDVF